MRVALALTGGEMTGTSSWRHIAIRVWSTARLVLLVGLLSHGQAFAQTRSITIAWDPVSGDVGGYFVYLSSVPGSVDSQVDVRRNTTYTLQGLEVGRGVFISVAAYSSAGVVGSRTPDLFFDGRSQADPPPPTNSGGALPCLAGRAPCPRPALSSSGPSSAALRAPVAAPCVSSLTGACFTRELVATGGGSVSSLVSMPDGTLLIAERAGRVIAAAGPLDAPIVALEPEWAGSIVHAALAASDVDTTGHVYVLRSGEPRSGLRELHLTRYQSLNHRLETPHTIVAGIIVHEDATPSMALDPAGHLYIAIPAGAGLPPYDGVVLRVDPEGQGATGHRAAPPVYASSPAAAVGVAVDSHGVVLSLEAVAAGWQLREALASGGQTYGPFAGRPSGLVSSASPVGVSLLIVSAHDGALTETHLADGRLSISDRLVFGQPLFSAIGSLTDAVWLAAGDDGPTSSYAVYRLRKPR